MKRLSHFFIIAGAFAISCNQTQQKPPAPNAAPREDILVANMDTSANPGDDFFNYANGGWLKRNPIPASESAWGIGNLVREELYVQLRTINETSAQKKPAAGTDEQKSGDFWTTATNEEKADRLWFARLKIHDDQMA